VSRGPAAFKQRDVAAAVRAVLTAGVTITAVRVSKDGTITILTSKDLVETVDAAAEKNEWDEK